MTDEEGTARLCKCGYPMDSGDNHKLCMLCLSIHEMPKCSVCKAMPTAPRALRHRLYNEARSSGHLLRGNIRMIFPLIHPSGATVPQKRSVEDNVTSYFSSLPDRERDSLQDKDDHEYASLSMLSPQIIEEQCIPISKRNLLPIPPERVEELKMLFDLNQAQLDTLRDQQSPQTQRIAELLRSAQ